MSTRPSGEDDVPPSKKARTDGEQQVTGDAYVRGSILKVELVNFMTYGHSVFHPGSRLNLILGPNGTGKSSLVCAICIGLAASPKLLGRADKIGHFVKRDAHVKWGSVEITLSGGPGRPDVKVFRKIKKDNSSEWKLRGKQAGIKDVEKLTKDMNIQIDNLCQFLPQDRVAAFAAMRPTELLRETERALSQREVFDFLGKHDALIEMKESMRELETRVANQRQELAKLQTLNSALEREVEKHREREQLEREMEVIKKKLPWSIYNEQKNKFLEAKENLEKAKANLAAKKRAMESASKPLEQKKRKGADMEKKLEGHKAAYKQANNKMTKSLSDLEDMEAKMEEIEDNMKLAEKRLEDAHKKIQKLELERTAEEEKLTDASMQPPDAHVVQQARETIKVKVRDIRELQETKSTITEKLSLINKKLDHCQRQLHEIDSVRSQRLKKMGMDERGVEEAHRVVAELRKSNKFHAPVYGPVACEVDIPSSKLQGSHSAILEQHVPNFIWTAFVTQDPRDRDMLQVALQRYRTPVINYAGDPNTPLQSALDANPGLKDLGVSHSLDQVFDAPHVVKLVMEDNARLAQTLLTDSDDAARVEAILKAGVDCLWTDRNQYLQRRSKYNKSAVSTRVVLLKQPRYLMGSADASEKPRLLKELQAHKADAQAQKEELKGVDSQEKTLRNEEARLRREFEKLMEVNRSRKKIEKRIEGIALRIKAHDVEKVRKEVDKETQKCKADMSKLLEKRFAILSSSKTLLQQRLQVERDSIATELIVAELAAQKQILEALLKDEQAGVKQAQHVHDQCENIVTEDKALLKARKKEAEKVCRLTEESLDAFSKLPDTVAELEERLSECTERVETMVLNNPNALQEYRERQEKIATLEKNLEQEGQVLDSGDSQVERAKQEWLVPLKMLVDKINKSFQDKFAAIGCAGTVELTEAEDFDKYAISIKVKFRQEEDLVALTANRQSGGERSVSTILYLMALQDLTACPFRVVDEINQGMDPINERKVFQQMVQSACRQGMPQCFLLTPKLLPDLEYSDGVTCLLIMNGPWIKETAKQFNVKELDALPTLVSNSTATVC